MDAKLAEHVASNLRGIGPARAEGYSTLGLLRLTRAMEAALLKEERGEPVPPLDVLSPAVSAEHERQELRAALRTFAPVPPDAPAEDDDAPSLERETALRTALIKRALGTKSLRDKLKHDVEDEIGVDALKAIEEQLQAMTVAAEEAEAQTQAQAQAQAKAAPAAAPATESAVDEEEGEEAVQELPPRKPRTGVRVVSLNACKLRTQNFGMHDQYLALVATLASFDVIVFQEIPATDEADAQLTLLAKIFEKHTPRFDVFQYATSSASGPPSSADEGKNAKHKERHAIFVRAPLRILAHAEIASLDDARFDYHPLQVLIEADDEAAALLGSNRLVVTSVHLPPAGRKKARDHQLRALLAHYPLKGAERIDEAFAARMAPESLAPKAAQKAWAKPIHLVCGDFNVHPGEKDADGKEVYGLTANGWARPLLGAQVPTSGGGKTLDNFLLDAESEQLLHDRTTVTAEVLSVDFLKRPATESSPSQKGVSDHMPIGLAFKKPLAPPPRE